MKSGSGQVDGSQKKDEFRLKVKFSVVLKRAKGGK